MTTCTQLLRMSLLTLCVVALLVTPAGAANDIASGDNDGGWGLPGAAEEATSELVVDVAGEAFEATLSGTVGTLAVSFEQLAETPIQLTTDATDAEIVAHEPLRFMSTADGKVRLFGEGAVQLTEGLQVEMLAPVESIASMTVLLVDQGAGSAAALIDDPNAVASITHVIPLPGLVHLDVDALAHLAVQHAPALADDDPDTALPAITVLHASMDPYGKIHETLVRVTADGGVEFVLR